MDRQTDGLTPRRRAGSQAGRQTDVNQERDCESCSAQASHPQAKHQTRHQHHVVITVVVTSQTRTNTLLTRHGRDLQRLAHLLSLSRKHRLTKQSGLSLNRVLADNHHPWHRVATFPHGRGFFISSCWLQVGGWSEYFSDDSVYGTYSPTLPEINSQNRNKTQSTA